MPKILIPDANAINFKGIDFSKYVVSFQDDRQPSIAMHTYLKRDGGEVEPMGRKPHETKFNCAFVGSAGIKAFKRLQASIDDDPTGTLVHPIYGKLRMCCQGFTGAGMDVENATNLYNVPLGFVEDSVDTKTEGNNDTDASPESRQSSVNAYATAISNLAAKFTTAVTATAGLVSSAVSYADAAVAASQNTTPDASLSTQLANVKASSEAVSAAIIADTSVATISGTAAKYDAVATVEQLYDACVLLSIAVQSQKPKLFLYIVPAKISILALAHRFYLQDGLNRVDEILANNAGKVADPGAIPGGTSLLMATPTNPRFYDGSQ